MLQSWLSISGLGFDIVGFIWLAHEWWQQWIQRYNEIVGTNIVNMHNFISRQQSSAKDLDEFLKNNDNQLELEEIIKSHKSAARKAIEERFSAYRNAFILVLIGFALQILGNWPGGIPAIGVYPASAFSIEPSAAVTHNPHTGNIKIRYRKIWPSGS